MKRSAWLELSAFATNQKAIKLYKKLGFKRWGVAPGYIKRKGKYIDLEYMYLKL